MRSYALKRAGVTAITLANAGCGFAAIAALGTSGTSAIALAAALVFAAWAFDVVDGMLANRLGVASAFGAALDSTCDAISFGTLPAVLVVVAVRDALGPGALAVGLVYLCAAIIRLARYTATAGSSASRLWFAGLPSPVAAMTVAATAFVTPAPAALVAAALVTAALMLSPLPYADLPRAYARGRIARWTLVVPVLAAVPFGWRAVLVSVCLAYVASGAVAAKRIGLRAA